MVVEANEIEGLTEVPPSLPPCLQCFDKCDSPTTHAYMSWWLSWLLLLLLLLRHGA